MCIRDSYLPCYTVDNYRQYINKLIYLSIVCDRLVLLTTLYTRCGRRGPTWCSPTVRTSSTLWRTIATGIWTRCRLIGPAVAAASAAAATLAARMMTRSLLTANRPPFHNDLRRLGRRKPQVENGNVLVHRKYGNRRLQLKRRSVRSRVDNLLSQMIPWFWSLDVWNIQFTSPSFVFFAFSLIVGLYADVLASCCCVVTTWLWLLRWCLTIHKSWAGEALYLTVSVSIYRASVKLGVGWKMFETAVVTVRFMVTLPKTYLHVHIVVIFNQTALVHLFTLSYDAL